MRSRLIGKFERRRDRLVVENVGKTFDRRVKGRTGDRFVGKNGTSDSFASLRVDRDGLNESTRVSS